MHTLRQTTYPYIQKYTNIFKEKKKKEKNLKFNQKKLIKAFKEEMNKFLKEIHENTFKQVKALKEEANKHKEIQENIVKQVKDMNKTVS